MPSRSNGVALDVPCGNGRHWELLRDKGFWTAGVDIDRNVLMRSPPLNDVGRVQLDALDGLPFASCSFDLIVVIHPHTLEVLVNVLGLLRCGGDLIFETFGAQGENWRGLPLAGEVAESMLAGYAMVAYEERPVRIAPTRVTVKGHFRKPIPHKP